MTPGATVHTADVTDLPDVDLLVIGGGINGAGIARDAVGRGLSVVLCEQGDLGEGTSSRSSKLIHGGLRYLEFHEFRLVREALAEREVLLANAPHLVRPMRFVLPHDHRLRPAWFVRLGLFLYDHLGHGTGVGQRARLPGTRALDLRSAPEGRALRPDYRWGFEYSDCQVDDARLVLLNALDAHERGALVLPRTRFTGAVPQGGRWRAGLIGMSDGRRRTVRARAIVNAAGPWVERVLGGLPDVAARSQVRLVKGSHLVVPKFWDGPQAYLIQNADGRVVFVIPWDEGLALVGTTEFPYEGDPADVAIDAAEIDYLCGLVNRSFRHVLTPADVLHTWSGVRPLVDDGSANPSRLSRDYRIELSGVGSGAAAHPPLLTVYGGKITTYRRLAEQALRQLSPCFPGLGAAWTAAAPLPGGDLPGGDVDAALQAWQRERPWMPGAMARRWLQAYGTRAHQVLGGARCLAELGHDFGATLTEREASYWIRHEWARSADDMLWRRSRLGLHLDAAQRAQFEAWLASAAEGLAAISPPGR